MSTPASPIGAACELIALPREGEQFLRAMLDAYHYREVGPTMRDVGTSCGLIGPTGRLTPAGYLVGNVAKEYLHWLDAGRKLVDTRPDVAMLRGRDVLDVGASFGRWIWWMREHARSAVGIEMQPEYIQLGNALAKREGLAPAPITCGSGAELLRHFQPRSFDLVFSRLVWNYLPIQDSLRQAQELLRPGGELWIKTVGSVTWRELLFRLHRPASAAWLMFSLGNSAVCNMTRRQLALVCPGRMHSVHRIAHPSADCWLKMLKHAGFEDGSAVPDRGCLIVRGRKAL